MVLLIKREWKVFLVCLAVLLAAYYLLPLCFGGHYLLAGVLIVNPLVSIGTGLGYGLKFGFRWYFPLIAGILFLPAMYLFYNESALLYAAIDAGFAAIGSWIGWIVYKNRKAEE